MNSNDAPQPDQLPPHDSAAEAGALACILTADDDAGRLLDQLAPDDFYDRRHREAYSAICHLRTDGKPLNSVSLVQLIRDNHRLEDAGGLDYLAALPDQTPSPVNFPTYFETVKERATRRALLRDAGELSRLAFDTTISRAALEDASRRLLEAHSRNSADREALTIRTPDDLLGMTFDDSDRILGDRLLATGQSLVIAGAGGIGKSRLLLQAAVATIAGNPFIGLETHKPGLRWLILQAENSNRRLHGDLAALRQWTGPEAWAHVNAQLSIHTLESDADGFMSLDNPAAQRRIAEAISATSPDVVCFDSLYNFAIGDLNKDEDMSATLLALSRLAKAGNPNRSPVVLHHARTGKAGAAGATGYDRASYGRNSKVLHSWTRGQLNVAPGSAEPDGPIVLTCGKCSNGKEFDPLAARLNPATMIYEAIPDFDFQAWQAEVSGKADHEQLMTPERVRELCTGSMSKSVLAKAIVDDCGCSRATSFRHILRAEKAKKIHWSKTSETYSPK